MFVTFEGPEGSGKSTALEGVSQALEASGFEICRTREPGSGPLGPKIRELLLASVELSDATELFLFLADRSQHVAQVIRPSLSKGQLVLCDRFTDSTVAYQGYGRGFPLEMLHRLNELATGGLKPDLTLLFDIEPRVGLARISEPDRIDSEALEFHERIRQGFLAEAQRAPDRFVILDASQPIDSLRQEALRAIGEGLSRQG